MGFPAGSGQAYRVLLLPDLQQADFPKKGVDSFSFPERGPRDMLPSGIVIDTGWYPKTARRCQAGENRTFHAES
jgi:hypothetical protein